MCMVYFIGTDNAIPLIAFDPAKPAFNVTELSEQEQVVREHFTKPHVHYVGSSTSCGCGFRTKSFCRYDLADEEFAKTVQDHHALADYVEQLVASGEREIEWYGCWSGDEGEKVESRRVCTIADIRRDDFEFSEREFLLIKK